MSPDSVLHMLHRVLKRAGLPKVRFHDLRHTFATLALQNGVDIKTVSGMLGHFSAGFTLDTYAHVTTSAKREAAKTMGNILSGAAEFRRVDPGTQRVPGRSAKRHAGRAAGGKPEHDARDQHCLLRRVRPAGCAAQYYENL